MPELENLFTYTQSLYDRVTSMFFRHTLRSMIPDDNEDHGDTVTTDEASSRNNEDNNHAQTTASENTSPFLSSSISAQAPSTIHQESLRSSGGKVTSPQISKEIFSFTETNASSSSQNKAISSHDGLSKITTALLDAETDMEGVNKLGGDFWEDLRCNYCDHQSSTRSEARYVLTLLAMENES